MAANFVEVARGLGATLAYSRVSGSTVIDDIGTNDATVNAAGSMAPPLAVGAHNQTGLHGDDSVAAVATAGSAALPTAAGTDLWSVFIAFKIDDSTGVNALWSQHAANLNTSCHQHMRTQNSIRFVQANGGGIVTSSTGFDDGLTHTTMVTREGDGTLSQYVDGVLNPAAGSYAETIVDEPFRLGVRGASSLTLLGDVLPCAVFNGVVVTAADGRILHNAVVGLNLRGRPTPLTRRARRGLATGALV